MAEGAIARKGDDSIISRSLHYNDGQMVVYANESNDLVLNEKFTLDMTGFQLMDSQD
jgi:hypothetical protein